MSDLAARLEAVLDARYHHLHPFNLRMHAGELTKDEIRTWVRNRYYYQTRIPIKDSLLLGKAEDAEFRRQWIRRIQDHDGAPGNEGGLARWLRLARAVGLDPDQVASLRDVLPGVRRACDAYVEFVASHDLLESVASSLTERRAGPLMAERIAAFEKHYVWVETEGLDYFRTRTREAPRDAEEGLAHVIAHAKTEEDAERAVAALERKCEILWQLLDAVEWGGRPLRPIPRAMRREHPEPALVTSERAVTLNETGLAILDLCDGTRTPCKIAAALRARHPEPPDVERECYAFLEEMEKLRMLEPAK